MRLDRTNRCVIYDRKPCHCASPWMPHPGTQPTRRPCPTCNGTGRGKRGGRYGCKTCHGSGTVWDQENRVTCTSCNGDYAAAQSEGYCDRVPRPLVEEVLSLIPIEVVRTNRGNSWNESHLGHGCIYSCTDYGAMAGHTDAEIRLLTRTELVQRPPQALHFFHRETGRLVSAVAVLLTHDGYSVRSVFSSVEDTSALASLEPDESQAHAIGMRVFHSGGNGTLAAASPCSGRGTDTRTLDAAIRELAARKRR